MWANLAIGGLQIFASEPNVSFDVAPNRLRFQQRGDASKGSYFALARQDSLNT